jgi:hypothetical protein
VAKKPWDLNDIKELVNKANNVNKFSQVIQEFRELAKVKNRFNWLMNKFGQN